MCSDTDTVRQLALPDHWAARLFKAQLSSELQVQAPVRIQCCRDHHILLFARLPPAHVPTYRHADHYYRVSSSLAHEVRARIS